MAEGGRNANKPTTGVKRDEWLDEFEREMRFLLISDAPDKKGDMLIYFSVDIRILPQSLQDPDEGNLYKIEREVN